MQNTSVAIRALVAFLGLGLIIGVAETWSILVGAALLVVGCVLVVLELWKNPES